MRPFAIGKNRDIECLLFLVAIFLLAAIVSCAPTGIYHTVEPGQNLYRISKAYGISEAELARINRVSDPKRLQVGQRIYVPGVTQPRQVTSSSVTKASPKVKSSTTAPVKAPSPLQAKKKAKTETTPSAKQSSSQLTKVPKGTFAWPVKGKLVSRFGAKNGSSNKGIEIACREGNDIVAAAPGKVIYSGRGIRGYGHLIILEHASDFFTVYGYNKENLVKTNDFVGQGDRIALCGESKQAQSSRLHFEIRKGKAAVDPIFYLP